MSYSLDVHDFKLDFGLTELVKVIAKVGGRKVYIPSPNRAENSTLTDEIGIEITLWLSARYGGEHVKFPSKNALASQSRTTALRAAVRDAGLTQPSRSANDIATEYGVTASHVEKLRSAMRKDPKIAEPLPLFKDI